MCRCQMWLATENSYQARAWQCGSDDGRMKYLSRILAASHSSYLYFLFFSLSIFLSFVCALGPRDRSLHTGCLLPSDICQIYQLPSSIIQSS